MPGAKKIYRLLLVGLFALIAGIYLIKPPIHGFADNGDFWRVMNPAGIEYEIIPPRYQLIAREFRLGHSAVLAATTSAALPAYIAAKSASLFSDHFDLRWLSALYLVIFISGLAVLVLTFGGWVFTFGLVWLSLEPNLFLHFNSFFSEALSIALFPWLLWGICGTDKAEKKTACFLSAFSLLVATSKFQFALVPLLILLTIKLGTKSRNHRLVTILLGMAFVSALLFSFLPASPQFRALKQMNRYQAVFMGIAPAANNPADALNKLGIPASYHYLSGSSLMEPPANGHIEPDLARRLEEISLPRIAFLYLVTPGAIINSLKKLQPALARTPLGYLGNYELETGLAGKTVQFSWQFSRFRDFLLSYFPWLSWILAASAIAILLSRFLKSQNFEATHYLLAFLVLHFFTQLVICVVGDGFYSIHRHLLSARLSLDLIFWLLLDRAVSRSRANRIGVL